MTLPINDLRHCPKWLRITDTDHKSCAGPSGRPAKELKGRKRKKEVVVRLYQEMRDGTDREIDRGTYRELEENHAFRIGTMRDRVSTGKKTRDGYSFKKVEEDQYL